jgi:hypothetical protein
MVTANQDASFLMHFSYCGRHQRFIERIFGARDGLPEVGLIGALKQEHLQVSCVNDNEDGFGDFRDGHKIATR